MAFGGFTKNETNFRYLNVIPSFSIFTNYSLELLEDIPILLISLKTQIKMHGV